MELLKLQSWKLVGQTWMLLVLEKHLCKALVMLFSVKTYIYLPFQKKKALDTNKQLLCRNALGVLQVKGLHTKSSNYFQQRFIASKCDQ